MKKKTRPPYKLATSLLSNAPQDLLAELREWIRQVRISAARVVDKHLCALYWRIGTRIRLEILKDQRAEYGAGIVSAVGRQLEAEFGRGFSEKSLRHMIRFAEAFPDEQIVSALRRQLTWTHFKRLIYLEVSGLAVPVEDPRKEAATFYKTSGLKMVKKAEGEAPAGPPFLGEPPDLETYRSRGHRRLDVRIYETKCTACLWACKMPVEMIIDHWNPSKKRYRFETFCYGPKSCSFYRAGPTRKVPGRKGMSYTEEDWVDEDATSYRGQDD